MAKIKGNKKSNKLKGTGKADKMIGLGGNDQIRGNKGDDKLFGGDGNDILYGGDGSDVVNGGAGNDVFLSGAGGDFYVGGAGEDTVSFTLQAAGVSIELLTMTSTFGGLQDAFSGIENINGTEASDTIEGDGSNNHFRAFGGNDYLKGGNGDDVLDGGEGNDQIHSDNGGDHLIGGNGIDSLVYEKAASGAEIDLSTGLGAGSAVSDTFAGFEIVYGSKFDDIITGTGVAETFFGEGGPDELFGNGANDILFGGAGADDLYGGEGNDRLSPEGSAAEADHLDGGNGSSDWADYDNAGAAVTVNLRNNTSAGRAAGDTYISIENVQGSDFGDTLMAGTNGRAYGGFGNDFIYDGVGSNVLRGERGDDHLIDDALLNPEDGVRDNFVLEVGLGVDTIQGFDQSSGAAGDRIWLPEAQFSDLNFDASGILAAGQVLSPASSHGATIAGAQLIFQQNTETLYYDADGTGSGAAVAIGKILGLASIASYDFVVVPNL